MTDPVIAVYTHTAYIPARYIKAAVASAQIALTQDFAPHWSNAQLVYVPPGGAIMPNWWQCVFFDHSDQADALGYHDVSPTGTPLAKIFAKDAIADRVNWVVTMTHEIWEMLADPQIDQTADYNGWQYAREVADAPEDDRYGHRVTGHLISNAVTPAWFDPNGKAPFTIYPCAEITAPFMLAPGGYIGRRQLPDGEWEQRFAEGAPTTARENKKATSRTMRRFRA